MTTNLTRRTMLATVAATATLPAAALAGATAARAIADSDPVPALVAECQRHRAMADELIRRQCALEDALPASLRRGIQVSEHFDFDAKRVGRDTLTREPIFAHDTDALRRHCGNDDAGYRRLLPKLRAWEATRDADSRWQEFVAADNALDGVWDPSVALVKRIADTPATTMAGAHEKARLLESVIAEGWPDIDGPLVRSLIVDLGRLAGAA